MKRTMVFILAGVIFPVCVVHFDSGKERNKYLLPQPLSSKNEKIVMERKEHFSLCDCTNQVGLLKNHYKSKKTQEHWAMREQRAQGLRKKLPGRSRITGILLDHQRRSVQAA